MDLWVVVFTKIKARNLTFKNMTRLTMLGHILISQLITTDLNSTIDLSHISSGIYIVLLKQNGQVVRQQKLVRE
ncbi:MAG: T9SS type A sorting domain-containing protein [Flavobacteriaceae bacterium]|nr:T9SS type A sorting domain-containing protein [Flavobacteriaceae bacterium]